MVLVLPPTKSTPASYYDHSNDLWLKRAGFVPRKAEDFRDGGAFPEIHIEQYPLDMGRDRLLKPGSKIVPVIIDTHGNIAYGVIVRQNENSNKILYSQHKDLEPKVMKYDCEEKCDDEELKKEIEKTTLETKAALEKIVNVRLSAAQPKNYKPSQQSAAFNSRAKERIIRMMEMPVDLLEPPKFKHKHVPKASGSPPVPVMHWKVPPCISNWKNPKGYTIPLDKRLAADGRGLQDVQINDNFAKLSEALYVSEQKAREAVTIRSKVQKEMMMKEKERKEHELRALAQKACFERTGVVPPAAVSIPSEKNAMDSSDMRIDREHAREKEKDLPKETREEREECIWQREKERKLEAKDAAMRKKSKITRDRNRDVSEQVALGMASAGAGAGAGRGEEIMYDQRLFNQEKGMDSGFATDDQYNVYDQGLFTAQPMLSTLYRPKKDVDAEIPQSLNNVGTGGTMRTSAGSSTQDGSERGFSRTSILFERWR
ncbi:hypothetical protein RGQ29_007420 [Quercus rubra]|uniref:SKI-interacting protein SKIP SNW domain-containing protein n=1 Tax=Quercus rubra TaxID=3512 RepID=A0AAN7I7A3_QUERU|nr:hypothetical protein RGQ29_007420 [Quercus rubra]